MMKDRPFGVAILAILAGLAAFLAAVHAFQFLGLIRFPVGPIGVSYTNVWYALMWGLMVWIYIWLARMLWRMDKSAWLFLAVITVFNLILNTMYLLGDATFSAMSISFLLNGLILIYIMLPGVREAFEVD